MSRQFNDNVGGVAKMYAAIPTAINVARNGNGTFHASVRTASAIHPIEVVDGSGFSFEENMEINDAGRSYTVEISGIMPRADEETLSLLRTLETSGLVVVHQDKNGVWKLSGTEEVPLQISYRETTGETEASLNGVEFAVSGTQAAKSLLLDGFDYPA